VRWAGAIGRDTFFSFLTSLASRDVMCRPVSSVVMSGCGGVVVVACLMGALRSSKRSGVAICPCLISLVLC
jgi:hypothetical protein